MSFMQEFSKFKFIKIEHLELPGLFKFDAVPPNGVPDHMTKAKMIPAIVLQEYGETLKVTTIFGDIAMVHNAIINNVYHWYDIDLPTIYQLLSAYFKWLSTQSNYLPPSELYAYNEIMKLKSGCNSLVEENENYRDKEFIKMMESGKY